MQAEVCLFFPFFVAFFAVYLKTIMTKGTHTLAIIPHLLFFLYRLRLKNKMQNVKQSFLTRFTYLL